MKSLFVVSVAILLFVFANCSPVADTREDVIDGFNVLSGGAAVVAAGAGATGEILNHFKNFNRKL